MGPVRFGAIVLMASLLVGCAKRSNAPEAYDTVKVGMSQARVLQLMGEPTKRMVLPLEGRTDQRQILFRYLTGNHLIHIGFVNGQVIGKEKH